MGEINDLTVLENEIHCHGRAAEPGMGRGGGVWVRQPTKMRDFRRELQNPFVVDIIHHIGSIFRGYSRPGEICAYHIGDKRGFKTVMQNSPPLQLQACSGGLKIMYFGLWSGFGFAPYQSQSTTEKEAPHGRSG